MIGLGIVGTDHLAIRMIKCVAQVEGVRVTAIASTKQGPAGPLADPLGAAVCADPAELASRPDVDAVYVNNSGPYHADAVRVAIAAGKPVLVQKPIALTVPETEEIVALARKAGVLLVENLWCLTVPAAQTLIARADTAAMGKPHAFSLDFGFPVKPELYPALFSPELGVLRDRAGYGIALARRLLGPVADLTAQVNWLGNVDTSAMILLRHRSGAMSKLGFSFDALMSNKATLACSGGLYRLEPSLGGTSLMSQVAEAQIGPLTKPPRRRIASLTMGKALRRFSRTPKAARYPLGSDLHLPMLRHFVDLVRAGRPESPLVPLDLSVETQRLVEQARTRVDLAA
ncbi:MAG: Gfo/Idh/MocA family oxidoreductase [Pseudomonadota bacterium]